jgi:hypothetical protein
MGTSRTTLDACNLCQGTDTTPANTPGYVMTVSAYPGRQAQCTACATGGPTSPGGLYDQAQCAFAGHTDTPACIAPLNGVLTCGIVNDDTVAIACQANYYLSNGACRRCAPGAISPTGNGQAFPGFLIELGALRSPLGELNAAVSCYCPNNYWGQAVPFIANNAITYTIDPINAVNYLGCQACGPNLLGPGVSSSLATLSSPAVACTACTAGYTYVFADVSTSRYTSPQCVKNDPPGPPGPGPKPDKKDDPKKDESKKDESKKDSPKGKRFLREMNVDGVGAGARV